MKICFYTPEYAANPPSTGRITPVMKPDYVSSARKRREPVRSSVFPNLPRGV